jgi:ribonuclease HII
MPPTVSEYKALLASAGPRKRAALVREMEADPRAAVRALAAVEGRKLERARKERRRLNSLSDMQAALHNAGLTIIAGVDEVGRGCLAGPVTACAVVLPVDAVVEGLDDSKRLTAPQREIVAERIRAVATSMCIVSAEAAEIDVMGIGNATLAAMQRAIAGLDVEVDHVLVDGNDSRVGYPSTAVVGGDSRCACIAAASVLAKVHRDALMVRLDADYPGYGLAVNKGYSTAEHLEAIRMLGITELHRRSFGPCNGTEPLF